METTWPLVQRCASEMETIMTWHLIHFLPASLNVTMYIPSMKYYNLLSFVFCSVCLKKKQAYIFLFFVLLLSCFDYRSDFGVGSRGSLLYKSCFLCLFVPHHADNALNDCDMKFCSQCFDLFCFVFIFCFIYLLFVCFSLEMC